MQARHTELDSHTKSFQTHCMHVPSALSNIHRRCFHFEPKIILFFVKKMKHRILISSQSVYFHAISAMRVPGPQPPKIVDKKAISELLSPRLVRYF